MTEPTPSHAPGSRRHPGAVAAILAMVVLGAAACAGSSTSVGTDATRDTTAPASSGTGDPDPDQRPTLVIVTTVAPVTSIVSAVVGDRAEVTGIVPEGTNSHTYEPRPSAAQVLAGADVVFLNGLQLEEPTLDLAEQVAKPNSRLVELGPATITEDRYAYDFSFPQSEGKPNPHLWTNPPMVIRYADIVRDTMIEVDPDGADIYRANHDLFAAKVGDLDRAMRTSFATIPEGRRRLLTYHDAYAYFAQEYRWQVIGAIQVSDFGDPTPKEVAALIDQVRAQDVRAIFGSEVFPSPVLEQIGRETGVRYVDVLRDDDLPDEPGSVEHSLIGLLRFDYVTMTEALGGDASALRDLDVTIVTPDRADYPQ